MTTCEYIDLLRVKYCCQKDKWGQHLEKIGDASLQEQMNRPPAEGHPASCHFEARIREIRENSPTQLADRDMWRLVDLTKHHIDPAHMAKVRDVYFAQIWTPSLNALATRSPSGDRVILVNRGCVMSFAYTAIALTDIAVNTPYSRAGAFVREDVQLYVAALGALGGPDVSDVIDIREIQSRLLLADQLKMSFADMLVIAMLCFVVAHELAHHVLGHQGDLVRSGLSLDGKTVEFYRYSRLKEFEADRYAWETFRRVQTEMSSDRHIGEAFAMSKYCVVAPLLFTLLIESVQSITTAGYGRRAAECDSHPCGYERRRALEPLIRGFLDEASTAFVVAVNFFFQKSVPAFFKGYLPPQQSVFVSSPIFGFGEEYYHKYGGISISP